MSRSRSRSLPRERPTRRCRSPSHDRRLSRRSKRSRSPDDRRRKGRSRSRSPSIASSRSESEERHHKKHKKHSKKKHHKKHKRDKVDELHVEEAVAPEESKNGEEMKEQPTDTTTPVDARSFFEQLQKQEAAKEPVGTVHAQGLPAPVSATAISTSDKWECSKAGCGHMNSKYAPACNKCGAMKRMTEWR
ncbi:hypothetical protein F443_04772 [Phytophthora nicotianae P1569]|uniref:RanBP2-type domain-containing protein n=1 Tax=Phytophthora nicotianae P1569 TaxID=1317065 RepID=V9FMG3_PHYNI|nr:hypothetical protein F443_04772 [Phytophthora nicotianae P1569]